MTVRPSGESKVVVGGEVILQDDVAATDLSHPRARARSFGE
jgi:hypothetical protein